MTGIERHFEEERRSRLALFQAKLAALRAEFADVDVTYVDHTFGADEIIEVHGRPGKVMETRRWSWK